MAASHQTEQRKGRIILHGVKKTDTLLVRPILMVNRMEPQPPYIARYHNTSERSVCWHKHCA